MWDVCGVGWSRCGMSDVLPGCGMSIYKMPTTKSIHSEILCKISPLNYVDKILEEYSWRN